MSTYRDLDGILRCHHCRLPLRMCALLHDDPTEAEWFDGITPEDVDELHPPPEQ